MRVHLISNFACAYALNTRLDGNDNNYRYNYNKNKSLFLGVKAINIFAPLNASRIQTTVLVIQKANPALT